MPAHARGRRRRRTQRESTAKLQRFDSATHFCENQPAPGSGPQRGNLRDLPAARHKRNAAVAAPTCRVSFASTESEGGKAMNPPVTHSSHAGQLFEQEAQRPKTRKGKWPRTRPRFASRNSARTADQDERDGRLRTSRPKSLEIPPPDMVDSDLASSAMRCKDLRRLVDGHVGSWAKSASASAEFPDRLSSGLSKLAAISGSSVRSTACPCDPWTLTSCLTDDENRALASLVAELLVREMKVQQTRPSSAGFSSTATSSYGFHAPGSGDVAVLVAKAAAASLHPRPPPARSFPHLSGPLALPVRKVIPPPLLPTSREVRDGGFRGRSHRFSTGPRLGGGSAGASASANARPLSASTASLPPNDKFWALLASQGLHPLSEQASVLFQTHLRYATPRVSPNSTVTA